MQDQILDMLLKEDEITWQTILKDLVKSEEMDPWNIDISILTNKYLEIIKKMEEMNFFVSGKVILASSILLNIKSKKLMTEHIEQFDNFLFQSDEQEEFEDFIDEHEEQTILEPRLTIKTPQTRKRKVSINDLVNALEMAIEVDKKRKIRHLEKETIMPKIEIPEKKEDITNQLKNIYQNIVNYFDEKKGKTLTFSKLIPSDSREDKIITFVPLLHLENQKKVKTKQEFSFGEIDIKLKEKETLDRINSSKNQQI